MPGVDWKAFLHTRVCLVLTTVLFFACICFIWVFASAYFENIEELNYPLWVEPEQIHLSLGENASQMVVTWTTFNATNSSVVLYGKNALDRMAHGKQSKFIDGGLERRVIYIHRVYLSNLEANETYRKIVFIIFKSTIQIQFLKNIALVTVTTIVGSFSLRLSLNMIRLIGRHSWHFLVIYPFLMDESLRDFKMK